MEKYVITGSLGNISKPIAEGLIRNGKQVSIITSDLGKVGTIEKLGAKAIVGSVQDPYFVNQAFKNADVVYTMIPPIWKTDNLKLSQLEVANNYINAIKSNGIKYVVNLSSVGAHLPDGNGPVNALHDFENLLNEVSGLHVKHLRPGYFYCNFLNQINMIKNAGIMGGNFGDGEIYLADTFDIADAAIDELLNLTFRDNSVRYIVSDTKKGNEIAEVLGKEINRKFPWILFSDEDQKNGLIQAGLPITHAENYTELGHSIRVGKIAEDLILHLPQYSRTKFEDFATDFAQAYKK